MTTQAHRRVAIIGTGVIARAGRLFLANGLEVVATDVSPNAEAALKRFRRSGCPRSRLGLGPGAIRNPN